MKIFVSAIALFAAFGVAETKVTADSNAAVNVSAIWYFNGGDFKKAGVSQ